MLTVSCAAPKTRYWYWRGWRIRYQVFGPAQQIPSQTPPLIMLHGFGASLDQWRNNASALAQERPVYTLDLLGFGHAAKASSIFTVGLWSAQVYDFWRSFINRPAVLIGHSLGALVALNTTVEHPETACRLIMLTLPAAREELLSGWLEVVTRPIEQFFSTPLLIRPLFKFLRQPWVIRGALRQIYQTQTRVDSALVEQFIRPTRERGAARTLCYLVRSRTERQFSPTTQALLPQLSVPTLLLWGQSDRIIPPTWGQQITPLNPKISLVVLPEMGHCLYDEQPDMINHQILGWLDPQQTA